MDILTVVKTVLQRNQVEPQTVDDPQEGASADEYCKGEKPVDELRHPGKARRSVPV